MTRLWDKGAPLDERVLVYTAGEDYALDERLVPYDARASIAHAEMLCAQKLLSPEDLAAIKAGYWSNRERNPTGIVPLGPRVDFAAPHDRGRLSAKAAE